jgi:hypothetical protein
MAEGFAPRHLESEIVALGQPGDAITAAQFTGEEAPPSSYFEGLVAAICRRWVEDGKPKAIVRVPPMRGGQSGALVGRLMQALSSHGARVLDATGTGTTDKKRFLSGLEGEKNRSYATSKYDVMVGIQRILEGTDWPVCSAVYCVGMPGSLNTVVQFLGRAMRLKSTDYPAEQRDLAKLVFFVPSGGGAALADLSMDHSRHALLTCCFLADHEVGQEWIVLREVRRGIEAALGSPAENSGAADAENEAAEAIDPEVRAEVELAIASAREEIVSTGGDPTLSEVMELTAKTRPDLPETALQRVATEILATQTTATGTAARKAIYQETAKRLRIDPKVKQAMTEAFAIVLEEFRDVTLKDSAVLESVGRQVHGVTGGQMREFAQRLRDAAPRPLTEEQILTWADSHHRQIGEWPGQDSGPVHDVPEEEWANINAALRNGVRTLPGGSSLAQLLSTHRGVRNKQDLPSLSVERILSWTDAYRERTGEWPRVVSGPIDDAPGETWLGVNSALAEGLRGLPGRSSLRRILTDQRGVRNTRGLPPLTEAQVLGWADAHRESTGQWPITESGPINNSSGEAWSGINSSLIRGRRGLPGGQSLAQFLGDKRSVRNRMELPPLTFQQILACADAHHERTGEWPKRGSGPIANSPAETWANVDAALSQGGRGLPAGSSLAQLLSNGRGVRNVADLPPLTKEEILSWADAHHARSGEWPNSESGPVADAPGETWAGINGVLQKGFRGFLGGSSLARLLAEERGVRNSTDLPPLTEEKVLAWADSHHERTGEWPKVLSGPVNQVPGEDWRNIHAALSHGNRGLPGGSSLARLLAEKRGLRNRACLPSLTVQEILAWAEKHYQRTGKWPGQYSGPVEDAPGEKWANIQQALVKGLRGLPARSSLARLIKGHRDARMP